MPKGAFATAINCIDGRVQLPVIEWLKQHTQVDYVDMVTEPGADGALAEGHTTKTDSIQERVRISVAAHQSRVIVVVGHHDCAGNPVSDETHQHHIRAAVETVKAWNLGPPVIGLWVGHDWTCHKVTETV